MLFRSISLGLGRFPGPGGFCRSSSQSNVIDTVLFAFFRASRLFADALSNQGNGSPTLGKKCKAPKRKTPRYLSEVSTYIINQAKWEAAREWCADRRLEFLILTEEHLNV